MIETIDDMPAGTIGFRSDGDLTAEDYRETLVPALKKVIERGDKVRMMFVVGENFRETPGGLFEDMKTGASLGAGHFSSWEKTALVTDQGWVRKAVRLFGWLAPGEIKILPLDDEQAAREWLAT
jgi:hypothetical protein